MKKLNQWRNEAPTQPARDSAKAGFWLPGSAVGIAILVLVVSTIAGCSLFDDYFNGRDRTFVGSVAFGFEVASFEPCNGAENWWITGGDAAIELQNQYSALNLNDYTRAYAKVKGVPSSRGQYGHLGAYQREFKVTDVLEVRLLEDGDCSR